MDEPQAEATEASEAEATSAPAPVDRSLVSIERLTKHFDVRRGLFGRSRGVVRAVEEVDLDVGRGETLGLVGESGCGKTTLGRLILRLIEPTSGRIVLDGRDVTQLDRAAMRPLRRAMQIVFQDPQSALDPRISVEDAIGEALRIHGITKTRAEERERVAALLDRVGLRAEHMRRYPHEFSGGQRQRIVIARALATGPRFVVADEPVSALDVSIQAQIVNLLKDLQDELGLAYLFVSHDLAVVRWMSHRIAVMYLGRIVEIARAEAIWEGAKHPYTRALLSAIPSLDPASKTARLVLAGDVPSPIAPPPGCPFHPRCPIAQPGLCDRERPPLEEKADGHLAACHLAE